MRPLRVFWKQVNKTNEKGHNSFHKISKCIIGFVLFLPVGVFTFLPTLLMDAVATPGLYLRKGEGCIAIPMTYRPKCLGSFELSVVSGKPCRIAPLREGWFWQSVPSRWSRETNTVGGCMNFKTTWQMNPKIRFGMKNKCKLLIVLSQEPSQKPAVSNASSSGRVAPTYTPAGFYVFIYTKGMLQLRTVLGYAH